MSFALHSFFAFTLGLVLILFAGGSSANATEWDIYLIGGQSNAAGWNSSIGALASNDPRRVQDDVMFYYEPDQSGSGNNGSWGDLTFGSGRTGSNFGPELTLGRTLADENPTRNIAIIKYAVGGADLAEQWNPDDPGDPADPSTGLYGKFLATINNATAALPAGDTFVFKGMAWMQGETDAGSTLKSAAYEANLTNFISRVRQDVGVADLPFSIGQLSAVPGRDGMGTVQNAQASIAAKDDNVSMVITSDLQLQGDNLHFTSLAQVELGIRFAAGLQGELNGIQIANPSFESTNQGDGGINSRNVSGWLQSNIPRTGNFNPNETYYSDTDSLDSNGGEVGTMDATNVLFFASNDNDEHVTQTLSSMAEVGTTYQLTVAVGDRDLSSRPNFAGYLIQLLSDGQVLATLTSTDSPGDATFTDVSLSYTVVAGDPLGPLGIRLGTNGAGSGASTDFDNVRLVAVPIPDPVLPGDFEPDGDVDIDDINFYFGNIGALATGALAHQDLDADGAITLADAEIHITNYVQTTNGQTGTFLGDLNLDGTVDVLGDASILVDNLNGSATSYGQGDINFDGVVDVLADAVALIESLGSTNNP